VENGESRLARTSSPKEKGPHDMRPHDMSPHVMRHTVGGTPGIADAADDGLDVYHRRTAQG